MAELNEHLSRKKLEHENPEIGVKSDREENLKQVYRELFDESVERYNVGKRKDRQVLQVLLKYLSLTMIRIPIHSWNIL